MKRPVKKKRIIIISLIIVLVLVSCWYFIGRFSYSKVLAFYPVENRKDSSLTIGIIGASWAASANMDPIIQHGLQENGFNYKVISSGQPGATSKEIYQNLFKETEKEFSSRFIIETRPEYCLLMEGGNDAVSQLGGKFNAYHTIHIIKTLLHYNIKPIVVAVPEIGVTEANNSLDLFSRYRNIITAYFTNHGEIENISAYRKIFEQQLTIENLKDSIILIDFDKVCADYNACPGLYSNPTHLSEKGYEKFCNVILEDLLKKMRKQ